MKKILVTGGSGWIGKYVVNSLIQKGYEVHATFHTNKPSHLSCDWHKVNLLCDEEVKKLIYDIKPSHLIHLGRKQCRQRVMYLLIITIGLYPVSH